MSGVVNVKPDAQHLRAAIYEYGAVAVAVDASNMTAWGTHYKPSTVLGLNHDDCSSEKSDTNHAVLAVGWGEYTSGDKTIQYFIVKNSWGSDWGNLG